MNELAVRYEAEVGGTLTITPDDVRMVISDNPRVTDKEVRLFLELCRSQRLNPFIREVFLVKYGDNPATIITGKEVFTKRAQRNPRFRGFEAGVTVITAAGELVRREGSFTIPGDMVVGGWAKVHVDGYDVPVCDEVSFDEYVGKKKDGSYSGMWASKPATMIRKVALVHALREAFPEDFQGLYDEAEMAQAVEAQAEVREACISPQEAQEAMTRWKAAGKTTEGIMAVLSSAGVTRMGELTRSQLVEVDARVMASDTAGQTAMVLDVQPVAYDAYDDVEGGF